MWQWKTGVSPVRVITDSTGARPGVAQSSHRAARRLDHYGKYNQPEHPQICARSKCVSYYDGVPFSGATVDGGRRDFEPREERAQHSRYISVGPETKGAT